MNRLDGPVTPKIGLTLLAAKPRTRKTYRFVIDLERFRMRGATCEVAWAGHRAELPEGNPTCFPALSLSGPLTVFRSISRPVENGSALFGPTTACIDGPHPRARWSYVGIPPLTWVTPSYPFKCAIPHYRGTPSPNHYSKGPKPQGINAESGEEIGRAHV